MLIGICDDEKEVRMFLGKKVKSVCPEAEIRYYQSGKDLLREEDPVDILLLDIHMPGQSGMETAETFRETNKNTVIIFVTALEEYVYQAFDVGAFHYLVKPFDDRKFKEVLLKAAGQYREKEKLKEPEKGRYLLLKAGGVHTKVFFDDIMYAEVFNRKVTIHGREGSIEYYGRLSDLEKQLGENFFRTHRAYLVHFKYVVRYDAAMVETDMGAALMAKQKYSQFVKRYMQYIRQERNRS